MKRTRFAAMVLAGVLPAAVGCQQDGGGAAGEFGMQLRFLEDDGLASSAIPESLYGGLVTICVAPTDADCNDRENDQVTSVSFSVGNPTEGTGLFAPAADLDGDTRPEQAIKDLPRDVALKVVVTASPPPIGTPPTYSARVDGVVLQQGRRRFLTVALQAVRQFTRLDPAILQFPETFTGRLGASVTPLPDGRVLVAGGFDFAVPAVAPDCPADGSVCFRLVASRKAFLFVPGVGRIYEVASPMLETIGRAFHAAVALPNGRVLIAGGTDTAILKFTPLPHGGWVPDITPVAPAGDVKGYLATFELFDPEVGALEDDPNRDGNPERGGFAGLAMLALPRLFAGAAIVPVTDPPPPPQVILIGGMNPPGATTPPASSWEIYDSSTGLSTLGMGGLSRGRTYAGLAPMYYRAPAELWIIGGVLPGATPPTDMDLITAWSAGTVGSPLSPGTTYAARNFILPAVAPLTPDGVTPPSAYVVAGSLGPRCTHDEVAGSYTPSWTGDHYCPPASVPPYVVRKASQDQPLYLDPIAGGTWGSADAAHVLGAAVSIGDGSVLIVGGAADFNFAATQATHRIVLQVGVPLKDPGFPGAAYPVPALFPAAATLASGDALFVGGMTVSLAPTPTLTLLPDVVVYNHE